MSRNTKICLIVLAFLVTGLTTLVLTLSNNKVQAAGSAAPRCFAAGSGQGGTQGTNSVLQEFPCDQIPPDVLQRNNISALEPGACYVLDFVSVIKKDCNDPAITEGTTPGKQGYGEGRKSIDGHCPPNYTHIGFPLENGIDCLPEGSGDNNIIYVYVRGIIRFLSVGVGIVVVIMIIWGGIQWITSGGNPQGIAAARGRIVNAIIALFLFLFMFAILNFLVPGGLLY